MSAYSGPNKTNDGLVFAYDMNNADKSWKGAPTTNLLSNPLPDGTTTGYGVSGGTGTLTYDPLNEAIKWVRNTYETWGAYHIVSPIFNGNLNTASQYTISFEWKTENSSIANSVYSYNLVQGNGQNAAASANLLSNSVLQTNGWFFFKYSFTPLNTGISAFNRVILGNQSTNISTFYWRKLQFENIGVATPFVNGTRSNTQSLLDLKNNSTITANSAVSYLNNGLFEFSPSNSNSTLTVPLSTSLNKLTGTINTWVFPKGYSGSNGIFVNRDDSTANALDWLWIGSWSSGSVFYFRLGNGANCCSQDLTINSWSSICPINTWTNVCVTWESNNFSRIYVNGNLINSRSITSIPNTNPSSTGRIGLGHDSGGTGSWNGSISAFSTYNRALTASEVAQNFAALRGRFGI
jgi:hypothetical protein